MRLDYGAGEFHLEWQGGVVPLVRIILAFVVAYYAYWRFSTVDEAAVDFTIELPEQCKKGWLESAEVLETPSIQVGETHISRCSMLTVVQISGSTAIHCYAPASGKLLGRINPTTAEGIDRAVARAQEAQVAWAKTTFSQRRRVLRTLQKCVSWSHLTFLTFSIKNEDQ